MYDLPEVTSRCMHIGIALSTGTGERAAHITEIAASSRSRHIGLSIHAADTERANSTSETTSEPDKKN